jgi:hypothetical protein
MAIVRRIPVGRVGLAVALSAVGLVAAAVPAGAAKVAGAGTVTCSYGSTMTFSPALLPGLGTPVSKKGYELITLAPATIGSCSGSVTAGSIPTSGTTTKALTFKIKPFAFNGNYYAGGCLFFNTVQLTIKHVSLDWVSSAEALRPTKVTLGISSLGSDPSGNLGFPYTGSATGSFAGAASLGLFFDSAGTTALQDCQSGSGSVSTLNVDPTQSSISLG